MDIDSSTANGIKLVRTDPPRAEIELANAADLTGAIALIYRGACPFTEKAQRAQNAGAVAVVFVNSDDEETHPAPVSFPRNNAFSNEYITANVGNCMQL